MASIIKNQILKHLSKFTKNLSPDKINLSTLKGEGELSNLELDEAILMELLDLPTWMRLKQAVCNKLSIKIQWTNLKSKPICLFLDEVILEVETCEEPRPPSNPAHMASYRSGGKYGFVDKVIDGIFVTINSVSVKFNSRQFNASLQLSRVQVRSVTPTWQKTSHLGNTKLRDPERGEILLFKEVEWQTTRIEATAVEGESSEQFMTTPLRFIANQSKIRIAIKKKLIDCSIISTRLMLYLDDLLWVLTDTQLKAAVLYANSLKETIEKSRRQSKNMAAEKLQRQGHTGSTQVSHQPQPQTTSTHFSKFDVQTTSYHLITSRIDLHLCDDTSPDTDRGADHNKQIEGGAMQVTIHRLSVDIYPYNTAGGERKHWYYYSDNQGSRNHWVQQLFNAFKKDVNKARETCFANSPSQSPAHLSTNQRTPEKSAAVTNPNLVKPTHSPKPSMKTSHTSQKPRSTKLLESCTVLKIEEFTIYQVSTADNTRNTPKKFLSSDKKQLHLPSDTSILHAEYTEYFFPEGIDYPVPHANLYILVNPVRLVVDYLTLLWTNYFLLNLAQSMSASTDMQKAPEHIDIKLEAVMPRVILFMDEKIGTETDSPGGMQLQISKLTGSNTRTEEGDLLSNLTDLIQQYKQADLFQSESFPNDTNNNDIIPKHFSVHANREDNPYICQYAKDLLSEKKLNDISPGMEAGREALVKLLKTNTLKCSANLDFWSFTADQVWIDFIGGSSSRSRPLPFVQAVPLKLWICRPSTLDQCCNKSSQLKLVPNSSTDNRSLTSPERETRKARKLLKQYYSKVEDSSECSDENVDNKCPRGGAEGDVQCKKLCDINLLVHVGGPIKAQMTHFQYLCLLRIIDSFTTFQSQMTADMNYFDQDSAQTPAFRFAVPIMVPELEFAMICPVVNEGLPSNQVNLPVEDMSTNDSSSISEDKSSGNPLVSEHECLEIYPNEDAGLEIHPVITKSLSDSTIQCHTIEGQNGQVPLQMDYGAQHLSVYSNSEVNLTTDPSSYSSARTYDSGYSSEGRFKNTSAKANKVKKSFATAMINLTDKIKNFADDSSSITDDDALSVKTDISDDDQEFEMIFDENEAPAFTHLVNNSETGSETDTQDDLSNIGAELDAAVLKGREQISVILFKLCQLELILQCDSADITARIQSKKLLTAQPGNMSYENFFSTFVSRKAIVLSLTDKDLPGTGSSVMDGYIQQLPDELGPQPMSEMFTLLNVCVDDCGCNLHGFIPVPQETTETTSEFPIKFKLTSGPGVGGVCFHHGIPSPTGETSFMDVRAKDCGLKFTMSSLTSLTSFIEDKITSPAMPMHVSVDRFLLTLQDDSTPDGEEIDVSPSTELMISNLKITRGQDGVLHLKGGPKVLKSMEVNSCIQEQADDRRILEINLEEMKLQNLKLNEKLNSASVEAASKISTLQEENNLLKEQLTKMSQLTNSKIEMGISEIEQENLKLQERILGLEEDLKTASEEKESLISTLKLMQDELFQSERKHHQRTSSNTSH